MFGSNRTRVMTYGQTIRDLILYWYIPLAGATILMEYQYLEWGFTELALCHLLGTAWLLLVGNHMWTGSWFLLPKEF